MMKKIVATVLIVLASTSVMAKPDKVLQASIDPAITPWSIDSSGFSMGILVPVKTTALIFYVNKTNASGLASDPVLVDCNGVPTMVHPGVSTVCNLDPNKGLNMTWRIDSAYLRSGSQGSVIMIS